MADNNGVLSRTALSGNSTDVLDGTGTFVPIASLTDAWLITGNAGTNPVTNFLGTTDAQDLVVRTSNTERIRVYASGRTEFPMNMDASGLVNTGVIEIGNALRLDGNEIITNTGAIFYINNDNVGDVQMDGGTFFMDASLNRVGIANTAPAYTLETVAGGSVSVNDGYLRKVRGLYLQDWDDNTGGTDNKYRLLARDGSWQFYDGGVVVGNYGNGTWSDLNNGYLIVEGRIGVATTAPSRQLDVNGTVRFRGGGPSTGEYLMAQNTNGDATWSVAGYGMVPIGTIVAWHKNATGVPALPAGWVECNGGTSNGIAVPNLNGATTSKSGDASLGRFLRGNTTSGAYQTDQSNNLRWINHDDTGNGDTNDFLDDDGTTITIRNYSTSGDRLQAYLEGVETRVSNMTVVWIMRTQ
jgi:hypothetical protein